MKGNLIQFNDNGAWCWYQDERAIVDPVHRKLVVGTDGSGSGVGGSPRSGDIEAVVFDLRSGIPTRFTLRESDPTAFYCDDHNAPGFIVRPDGKYLSMYAAHFNDTSSYYRIYDNATGTWSTQQSFNWKLRRPGGSNFQTTYSNLLYLSAESRLYNFVRGNNKSPNCMISANMGDTWTYGGQLTRNDGVGYNNGYYRYYGNGVDRIDFVFTEYHPRDFFTSLYHGYIQGGKSYASNGALADDNVLDTLNIPTPANFTKVFSDSTILNGYLMRRCWNTDVVRYADGTIVTIATARTSQYTGSDVAIDPEHAYIYCRFNGSSWTARYLCKAGQKMYSSEADYVGNAAVHPNDPNTIYISSSYDPRDSSVNMGVREIFKGVTTNQGLTWTWTAITQKSVRDNFRPIIPNWDNNNTALLWWRGTYSSAQSYNTAVVGIIERQLDSSGLMNYVDATSTNTTLASGSVLVATGPDSGAGVSDSLWHWRLNYGNGNSLLASAEVGGENSPTLKTQARVPAAGTYDLWINFWGNPTTSADWRIKAGLSTNGMRIFRSVASKEVELGDHANPVVLTGPGNTFLYQAYLGRVDVSTNDTFRVYVDDEAIQTGTIGTRIGNTCRTWYDGFSYARVNSGSSDVANNDLNISKFSLRQNYPNPFNPSTSITYSLPRGGYVRLSIFNILGQEMARVVDGYTQAGVHNVVWNASNVPSGVYFCTMEASGYSKTTKMVLIR